MSLGFNTLFGQRDVRETPKSTSSATALSVTDATYLTLSLNSDLTDERVLTAGGGIDFADTGANGTLTISGEDATTTNKGICSFTAGEGIDVVITAGDAAISGEDASSSNKGIASLSATDFTASSGAISITLHIKIIDIGDWDMDATASVAVAHGLTLAKIRGINVLVRNDADDTYYQLDRRDQVDALINSIDATNVNLTRLASGLYDATTFDATTFNRGWIIVDYVD